MAFTTYTNGQTITHTILNENFDVCVRTDSAKTISVTHTWSQVQTLTGGWTAGAACTISTGGLTITAGGLTVTAGGISVVAGGLSLNGTAITSASTISATGAITNTNTTNSLIASGDISVPTTKKLAMNVGKTTYIYESATQTVSLYTNSAEIATFTNGTGGAANDMGCFLWDVSAAALVRVSRGASDSGGSGFRLLRIPN